MLLSMICFSSLAPTEKKPSKQILVQISLLKCYSFISCLIEQCYFITSIFQFQQVTSIQKNTPFYQQQKIKQRQVKCNLLLKKCLLNYVKFSISLKLDLIREILNFKFKYDYFNFRLTHLFSFEFASIQMRYISAMVSLICFPVLLFSFCDEVNA